MLKRRERLKAQLLDTGAPLRHSVMKSVRDFFRDTALRDPDMWPWFRGLWGGVLNAFFLDIEREVESTLESSFLKQEQREAGEEPPELRWRSWPGRAYIRLRAALLHRYIPCDKSFFGQMKDPVYLMLLGAIYFEPFRGYRITFFALILLMLLCPGPPDEYQLVNFILQFKRTQFFSQGMKATIVAGLEYFACSTFSAPEDLKACIDRRGPGLAAGDILEYLCNVLLVWAAFFYLPLAEKHVARNTYFIGRAEDLAEEEEAEARLLLRGGGGGLDGLCCGPPLVLCRSCCGSCCCRRRHRWTLAGDPTRGGRLGKLLFYDMRCFLLALFLLMGLAAVRPGWGALAAGAWNGPELRAEAFWAKVLHAYLALPFAVFAVPLVGKILTHSDATGFDATGACMAHALPDVVPLVGGSSSDEEGGSCFSGLFGLSSFFHGGDFDVRDPERASACSVAATGAVVLWFLVGWFVDL